MTPPFPGWDDRQVPVVLAGVEHYSQKEARLDKTLVDTLGDGPMMSYDVL